MPAVHPDCTNCCEKGRCHFCNSGGPYVASFVKEGTQYKINLCRTHFAWCQTDQRAPKIDLDEAYLDRMEPEQFPESVKRSESYNYTIQLANK